MGAANGTQLRLVDADVELRRETRDFARWTLADVEELRRRFKKTFGFAVTASQFESLLLLKAPESVGIEEIFEALDTNCDGRVDGLELLAALACVCRASFEGKARFAFDLFDFNHNGSLSLAELALLMKSVLVGMTLLTGGGSDGLSPLGSQSKTKSDSSMEVMLLCLDLAENAFSRVDKGVSMLSYEAFIAWARSNRDFMMQVERFRLIAEKAVGFEDALSLPDGSDDDSDLDVEDEGHKGTSHVTPQSSDTLRSNGRRQADIPQPWMMEPSTQPHNNASMRKDIGMPPPVNLCLDWIYGTNGPSTRNACRLVATGEAVYFVGSYAVLYSSECHEQRYYRGHRRAIGCIDVNASGETVATGDSCSSNSTSRGAEIHVWNARTLQCLAVLRNFHPAGVAHISFPATASAATATLRQTQAVAFGERSGAGGHSSSLLSSNLMKKKPQETEALIASIGNDEGGSMALWNWQKEAVVVSGRAHPSSAGRRARSSGGSKRPLALALNEDGDEIVVVGAHFVVFHQIGGRFFKHKKPHWNGTVDPPLQTIPTCVSACYYGIQSVVVGTARGELFLFERHTLTRCVQAHDIQSSVNTTLLSCQSMILFSAGKNGQIKQWDSTLKPIGQTLDLHALLQVPEVMPSPSSSRPENVLEGDDFRICSLDYDAVRRRFLVGTRAGNIFEVDDVSSVSLNSTVSTNDSFRWKIVASGHAGHPTRDLATASVVGGCFASCGFGDRFVKLWSLRRRTFVQQLRFPGATAIPSALAFSSNGERLAVGSDDGTVMLARRSSEASSSLMTIEASMKNTSCAVVALRFGPLQTEPILAVARNNGLIYLYKVEPGGRRFSRYMLLKPQAGGNTEQACEAIPAHALDFSVDGAFLRTQHGASLCFWDLRHRAGTRVTAVAMLRNVEWHSNSISIGWNVAGLSSRSQDEAGTHIAANPARKLTLVLRGNGSIDLAPFPCPPLDCTVDGSSENCWFTRRISQAHLAEPSFGMSSCRPPLFGDFALRGSLAITSSEWDPAICQWRVEKELGDVQPRPPCLYDAALRKRLGVFGLRDVYFGLNAVDDDEEEGLKGSRKVARKSGAETSHAAAVRTAPTNSTKRSEAPDLSLTLSYVYGINHHGVCMNQSIAGLGNGSYMYGAGTFLIVRHLRSLGTRQRTVPSGLEYSVSLIAKHPSEPILAVGSRIDGHVMLLRTEKTTSAGGAFRGASFQRVTTLKAADISGSTTVKQTLISMAFCNTSDTSTSSAQSDLAAVIWKESRSHVHTLVFYAWKRQLVLAHVPMTRLPVLFGIFSSSSAAGVHFVTGGIDHVTFWHLNSATGHVAAQQGVFGRFARVQAMACAANVSPFVVTGGEDGSVVLWESGVAVQTASASSSTGNTVIALEHLSASQQVLGALRSGSLVVWRYNTARSPTRGSKTGRVQADTFLQLVREISFLDAAKAAPTSNVSPLLSTGFANAAPSDDLCVRGMCLLDDSAVAAILLSSGRVISVDLESILEGITALTPDTTRLPTTTMDVGDKARMLLDFSSEINDVALHPRDLRWASANSDGHVCTWNLHTNLLSNQQAMPSAPRCLTWSATGEHLAVSLSSGTVVILNGTTLELLLQFNCGDTDSGPIKSTGLPKWCTLSKYSPVYSQPGSNGARNLLALACRDYNIYVYAWESTGTESSSPVYTLCHTFEGHTAPVDALDFSLNCEWLQSATTSTSGQILRWPLKKEVPPAENSPPARVTPAAWDLLDDVWATWTASFSGPVAGLARLCGVGKVTSLARVNSDGGPGKDSDSASALERWSSPLPTMIVGLDGGILMLAWYPLTRGDVTTQVPVGLESSKDPTALAKEYIGCLSCDSLIRRIAFSFSNSYIMALARDANGSTQVLVWKTDYEEELRLQQRFAQKAAASSEGIECWYSSPVDRTLFEACSRDESTTALSSRNSFGEIDGGSTVAGSRQFLHDKLYLEFIYGLNPGATGSRNVFYADDAWEIVYAAGACGVVYNTKTQTQLLNCCAEAGHHRVISALAVHPKGDLVASGECFVESAWSHTARGSASIVIWDANSGSTVARVTTKHRPGILMLEFSPDGRRLASIGMEPDHTLAIYTICGGENEGGRLHTTLLMMLKTSTRRVWGLSFGEDGELATCGDQHILFWQQSGENESRNGDDEVHAGGLKSGLLSSHKECNPQAILLQTVHMAGRAHTVASSQADGSIYLWKDRVCVMVRRDAHGNAPIPALTVDRKQSLLYSAGADGQICTWNAQLELVRVVVDIGQLNTDGSLTNQPPLTSTKLQSIAVRDGHILFTTAGHEICELVESQSIEQKRHDPLAKDWRLQVYVRGHSRGQLCGLAVHPCKRAQFASAGDDGTVRLWDAATRSLLALHRWKSASAFTKDRGGNDALQALAFSADGKHLAVGTASGAVRILTAALNAVVIQWSCWQGQQQSNRAVLELQYSPDGKLFVVGDQDGSVHLHNAVSYQKVIVLRSSTQTCSSMRLDFARDRDVLRVDSHGVGGHNLRFWELGSWKELPPSQMRDAHWESKCPSLISGSNETDEMSLQSNPMVGTDGHATPVTNWAITKNQRFLLSTGGADRVVCQFRLLTHVSHVGSA